MRDTNKKISLILIYILGISAFSLFAQEYSISGRIIDDSGEPVMGATIRVTGTSIGTISDMDGTYSIQAKKNDILLFSFIGMEDVEKKVSTERIINVVLKSKASELDELVVVGYGTMKKSDLTGAISSVRLKNIEESGATNLMQTIQGRTSGVNVSTNSGVPGSIGSITIRGTSSMSTSSQPLYVIDGLIIDSEPATLDEQTALDPLQSISPEDIQSIEVLKDASATAIYGARGANGVILITTKQAGKGANGKITFNTSQGISRITRKLDVLDANLYGKFINEMLDNGAVSSVFSQYETDGNGNILMKDDMQAHNWQNEYFVPAYSSNYRLSFSEGKGNTKTYLSGGALHSDGVIKNTGMKKYDVRANYSTPIKNYLVISSNISAAYVENKYTTGTTNTATSSIMRSIYLTRPLLSGDDLAADGEINDGNMVGTLSSPDAWIKGHQNDNTTKTFNGSLVFDWNLYPWLKFQSRPGINHSDFTSLTYYSRNLRQGRDSDGLAGKYVRTISNVMWDNLFLYNVSLNKKNRLDGTIGMTMNKNNTQAETLSANGFIDDTQLANVLHSAINTSIEKTFKSRYSYLSFLGRMNYNYDNKFLATMTFRADGASKFAKGNKWGFFPAFSGVYNLHEEGFLKDNELVSRTKIRIGWGRVGNSPSPVYATVSQFGYVRSSDADGNPSMSIVPQTKGNPDLTWETLEQTNVGFDIGLLNNRLNFGIDLYYKMTKDQIQNVPLPTESGFSSMWMNRGSIENKGIDLEVDLNLLQTGDWKINAGGTFSLNRNKIVRLGLEPDEFGRVYFESAHMGKADGLMVSPNVYMEGAPVGAFWGYRTDGIIFDEEDADNAPTFNGKKLLPGDIKFVDVRGVAGNTEKDRNVTPEDKEILGDPNPDFVYSFRGEITYKKIFFNYLFSGSYGSEILNANNIFLENMNDTRIGFNKSTASYVNAWREKAPSREYPRLMQDVSTVSSVVTDRMIEDGSFLKLSQITLGYSFTMLKQTKTRLYITGNNLLYFTKYSGYTSEIQRRNTNTIIGVDLYNFPDARSVLLGLNLTF